jgi:hypothetical protein
LVEESFLGTREFDGLKVMMVLLANYDTRLENNRVLYQKHPDTGEMEARYVVTDIGATLGKVGGLGGKRIKNSLSDYQASKFILTVENGVVEFDYSTRPQGAGKFASLFNPGYGKSQANKEKAMRRIPCQMPVGSEKCWLVCPTSNCTMRFARPATTMRHAKALSKRYANGSKLWRLWMTAGEGILRALQVIEVCAHVRTRVMAPLPAFTV